MAADKTAKKVINAKIKWFDLKKGYGYATDKDGNDIFVHFKAIKSGRTYVGYNTDDVVELETVKGPKGMQARNVTLVETNTKE